MKDLKSLRWPSAYLLAVLLALLAACGSSAGLRVRLTATPALPAALEQATVYVATFSPSVDNDLYALNARTDAVRWKQSFGAVAVSGGLVYVVPRDGSLYTFDAGTGKQVWQYKRDGAVDGYPNVANGPWSTSARMMALSMPSAL